MIYLIVIMTYDLNFDLFFLSFEMPHCMKMDCGRLEDRSRIIILSVPGPYNPNRAAFSDHLWFYVVFMVCFSVQNVLNRKSAFVVSFSCHRKLVGRR